MMTHLPDQLPDDVSQLKSLVLSLAADNQALFSRLQQLLRQSYGRKSERLNPAQLELFRELLAQETERKTDKIGSDTTPAMPVSESKGHGRCALPAFLPRKDVEHDIGQDRRHCRSCGCELCLIGEDVSEQYDFVPASFYVRRHIRKKYACKACGDGGVVVADLPEKPIQKGLAASGLLAHVLVSKYADHLPLHRLEGIFERHGVTIARSTMCDWIRQCAELLEPLYDAMKERVVQSRVIHTDDIPVPVRSRTSTRLGRLWTYVGDPDHPYVVYDYTSTRCREGPETFLNDYKGYMQADAYAGYNRLYRRGVVEVGCWAHARRKFYDADNIQKRGIAAQALEKIAALYRIESEAKGYDHDQRRTYRREHAKPCLDDLRLWLHEKASDALPKSATGKAIHYALNQWQALNRYLEQGFLAIDNNAAERTLRRIAVGRKNWMFAGSDRGGRWAAIVYSVIASCQRHSIDPFGYLCDVLDRMPTSPAKNIADFFPDRWAMLRS